MFFPLSLPSQAVNMGSNSLSSSCSDPMEGQPKGDGGIRADLLRRELCGGDHRHLGSALSLGAFGHRHGHGLGVSRAAPIHNCNFTHKTQATFLSGFVMVETSTSHGELLDGFPLLPLPGVDFAAHLVFLKEAPGGLFVAVDLPAAHALVIARPDCR